MITKDDLRKFWQPFMGEAKLCVKDMQGNVIDVAELEYHMGQDGEGKISLMIPGNVKIAATEEVLEVPEAVAKIVEATEFTFMAWVDGACHGNPGPGGWAYLIKGATGESKEAGRVEDATNQKMELTAALQALNTCHTLVKKFYGNIMAKIRIHSDSEYVVKTMLGKFNGTANRELIQDIKRLCALMEVDWVYTLRNSNDQMAYCDSWAKTASKTPGFRWQV